MRGGPGPMGWGGSYDDPLGAEEPLNGHPVRDLSHEEAAELLGAFSLGAVSAAEAAAVDQHLAGCLACIDELEQYRTTAAMLRTWAGPIRRSASIPGARPPRHAPGRRRRRVGMAVVGALVVVPTVSAAVIRHDARQRVAVDLTESRLLAEIVAVQADPSTRWGDLRAPHSSVTTRTVVAAGGRGFVWNDSLPPLPADRTYQLWAVIDGVRVPAAVLGRDPGVSTFRVPSSSWALAITSEPRGGSIFPTGPAVVSGRLAQSPAPAGH